MGRSEEMFLWAHLLFATAIRFLVHAVLEAHTIFAAQQSELCGGCEEGAAGVLGAEGCTDVHQTSCKLHLESRFNETIKYQCLGIHCPRVEVGFRDEDDVLQGALQCWGSEEHQSLRGTTDTIHVVQLPPDERIWRNDRKTRLGAEQKSFEMMNTIVCMFTQGGATVMD